jgi:hypothetical protein
MLIASAARDGAGAPDRNGQLVIFVVANGGAGLVLIGQDVAVHEIPTNTHFLFVRPTEVAARACVDCAVAARE